MHLNHPETIHLAPSSMEKMSSTKPGPGAKKVRTTGVKDVHLAQVLPSGNSGSLHVYLEFGGIYLLLKCPMAILSTFFFFFNL